MQKIFFILVLCFYFPLKAQTSWDSLVIERHTWRSNFEKFTNPQLEEDVKVGTEKKVITTTKKINHWWQELNQFTDTTQLLTVFGIDTLQILQNPESLIAFYNGYNEHKINRNSQQKEFLMGLLGNTNVFKRELQNLINGTKYSMHRPYCYNYTIKFYAKNNLIAHYTSSKVGSGYCFTFVNQNNKAVYSFTIDKLLAKIFQYKSYTPITGKDLLKYLTNQIIRNNMATIYKLSSYTFKKEIDELSTDFSILSFEEVYARGRYIDLSDEMTIKIVLKNEIMLPNVYLNFMASANQGKLYTRDSIKVSYKNIINRIQNTPFIRKYLIEDSTARLDIYFFDSKGINQHGIKNITGRNYGSCNCKWDNQFVEQAIFFELEGIEIPPSIFFLLPDDNILGYYVGSMQSITLFDKSAHKLSINFPFVCLVLDKNGKLIPKN